MFKLRPYQQDASDQGVKILNDHHILILNFEVRTGKTHIALDIAKNYDNVLFVTKKKAISSIQKDYDDAGHSFNMTVINYESLHKVTGSFDLVIADESHGLGAFPKPTKKAKELKKHVNGDLILMSGTLLPESNAQIYHQLWCSRWSPFQYDVNFYKWHRKYGTPKLIYTSYGTSNDYSEVNYDLIYPKFKHLLLSYTQEDAGFRSKINEHVLTVKMKDKTYNLCNQLKKDLVIEGKDDEVILADTSVKLMQKLHQLYSGTIKCESGNRYTLDKSKIMFIKEHFKGKKLVIFYKFIQEYNLIKSVLDVTQDIDEFNSTDKHIALQIVSGREGINLSKGDAIIMYNIDFSAVSYWQSRDRMTTINRMENDVYWIFAENGIEWNIFNAVKKKKNYTLQTFKKNYGI